MNAAQAMRFGVPVILKLKEIFENQEENVYVKNNIFIEFKKQTRISKI